MRMYQASCEEQGQSLAEKELSRSKKRMVVNVPIAAE